MGGLHVLVTCGTGTVCSAIAMERLRRHRTEAGLPYVPMDACAAREIHDHMEGVAFVVALVPVPDDLGVFVLEANALLYRDDAEVFEAYDRLVADLLG